MRRHLCPILAAFALLAASAHSQLSERPGLSTGGWTTEDAKDLTGYSIKNRRIRVLGSFDATVPGTSSWFVRRDPWLAFQLGRNMYQREWRERDGASGHRGEFTGEALEDGLTQLLPAADVTSCATCHGNVPREPGPGLTIPKNGGKGRNTLSNFGLGPIEMIGLQTRLKLLAQADPNRDGWISRTEMRDQRLTIVPAPGAPAIGFGVCGDLDRDGRPDLNNVLRVWYVDGDGRRLPNAKSLEDDGVAGFSFAYQIFGWGHRRGAIGSTLRRFAIEANASHFGLEAFDPISLSDPDNNGVTHASLLGAEQFSIEAPTDRGATRTLLGLSADDPDGDGCIEELTQGDIDLLEFFLLHSPIPAQGPQTPQVTRGRSLFNAMGCASCHVPDWRLEPADPANADFHARFAGDRRLFELTAAWNQSAGRYQASVRDLSRTDEEGRTLPRREAATIAGVFSDFLHHDMGDGFAEQSFDGSIQRQFRTPPLWGVANGAPYGHDGGDLTLDAVIRRHGGEAQVARDAFVNAPEADRLDVLAFLNSLVLYQTDQLLDDRDNDGQFAADERFDPEARFRVPPVYEGLVQAPAGGEFRSLALRNRAEAYGETLEALIDTDSDGFPDIVDPCVEVAGFLDGCRSELAPYLTIAAVDFAGGPRGWSRYDLGAAAPAARFKDEFGAVQLDLPVAGAFGGFQSPPLAVTMAEEGIVRVSWTVSATIADGGEFPEFRLLAHHDDFAQSDALAVAAVSVADVAHPKPTGTTYRQFLTLPAGTTELVLGFDAIAGTGRAAGSSIRLHGVRVEALGPTTDLGQRQPTRTFDLTGGGEWTAGSRSPFVPPQATPTSEGWLLAMPGTVEGVFGWIESPEVELSPVAGEPLISVRATAQLASRDGMRPPVLRVRVTSPDGRMTSVTNRRAPVGSVTLQTWLAVPRGVSGRDVRASLDTLGFEPATMDPQGSVLVREAMIDTYRAPTLR